MSPTLSSRPTGYGLLQVSLPCCPYQWSLGGPVPCQGADSCSGPRLTWFDHMSPKMWDLSAHAYLTWVPRAFAGVGVHVPGLSEPSTALPLISST